MNPGSEYKEIMLPAFAFLTFDQTSILRRLFPSHIIFPRGTPNHNTNYNALLVSICIYLPVLPVQPQLDI